LTRGEVVQLMFMVTVGFPAYLQKADNRQKQAAVTLWESLIGGYDYNLGLMAVNEYLRINDSIYQSDNVPLGVLDIIREIRSVAVGRDEKKFQFEPINEYIAAERKKAKKALPPKPKTDGLTESEKKRQYVRSMEHHPSVFDGDSDRLRVYEYADINDVERGLICTKTLEPDNVPINLLRLLASINGSIYSRRVVVLRLTPQGLDVTTIAR
jgi:hypothetical protein